MSDERTITDADDPAFPNATEFDQDGQVLNEGHYGLTMRELFAIEIMAGMAASEGNGGEFWSDDEKMAQRAVRRADKLLVELAK